MILLNIVILVAYRREGDFAEFRKVLSGPNYLVFPAKFLSQGL